MMSDVLLHYRVCVQPCSTSLLLLAAVCVDGLRIFSPRVEAYSALCAAVLTSHVLIQITSMLYLQAVADVLQ